MECDGYAGLVCHGPEAVIDGVPVGRTAGRRLAVDHRTQQALVQGPLQLLDGPGDVMHRDHTHADEPLGVVRHELRLPVIKDLRAGLHYLDIRVAQDGQHAGGIEHLRLEVRRLLEPYPPDSTGFRGKILTH